MCDLSQKTVAGVMFGAAERLSDWILGMSGVFNLAGPLRPRNKVFIMFDTCTAR